MALEGFKCKKPIEYLSKEEIIKIHNGSLEIESIPNKGTRITIEVPYDRALIQSANDNEISIQNAAINPLTNALPKGFTGESETKGLVDLSSAPKILVIEDDEEIRKYIVSILMDRFQIDEAGFRW